MVSEEERCPVRVSMQATPVPRSDQRTCRLLPVRETEEAVQDEQRDSEARSRVLTRKDIQVVVAIAMPCRPRRIGFQDPSKSKLNGRHYAGIVALTA
jgi:hypothetical protein